MHRKQIGLKLKNKRIMHDLRSYSCASTDTLSSMHALLAFWVVGLFPSWLAFKQCCQDAFSTHTYACSPSQDLVWYSPYDNHHFTFTVEFSGSPKHSQTYPAHATATACNHICTATFAGVCFVQLPQGLDDSGQAAWHAEPCSLTQP